MTPASAFQARPLAAPVGLWRWLEGKLARVTSAGDLIPEFEGVRFFGIVAVIIHHLSYYALQTRMHGVPPEWNTVIVQSRIAHVVYTFHVALPFFFVVSGCLLGRPFAAYYLGVTPAAPSLSSYYIRRIGRIEPPYLLALTASFLAFSWAPWRSYVAGLFYLHGLVLHSMNTVNVVFWSLECEAMFYVLTPFIAAAAFRVRPAWLRRALLLGVISAYGLFAHRYLAAHHGYLLYTIVGTIQYFLAGMLLADLYVSGEIVRRRSLLADAAAVAAFALVGDIVLWHYFSYGWTLVVLIPLIYAAVIQGRIVNRLFCIRPLGLIGGMCYSIYLWHILVLHWSYDTILTRVSAVPSTIGGTILLTSAVFVPLIVLLCAPIYYFTEKPFVNGPGSRYITRLLRPRVEGAVKRFRSTHGGSAASLTN